MPLTTRQRPLYEVKANLFKGLAHPFRIRILELLSAVARGERRRAAGRDRARGIPPLAAPRRAPTASARRVRAPGEPRLLPAGRSAVSRTCSRSRARCSLTVLEADRDLLDDARSLPPLPGPAPVSAEALPRRGARPAPARISAACFPPHPTTGPRDAPGGAICSPASPSASSRCRSRSASASAPD